MTDDSYQATIRGVLADLGVGGNHTAIPAPRTRRQSNDLNEAWVARYLAERVDR